MCGAADEKPNGSRILLVLFDSDMQQISLMCRSLMPGVTW